MDKIEKIRQYIESLYNGEVPEHDQQCEFSDGYFTGLSVISNFLDALSEEPEEESDLQDAEVIFSGYALHTDVTKWADGHKLKIRIYDEN